MDSIILRGSKEQFARARAEEQAISAISDRKYSDCAKLSRRFSAIP
jgi:hypothetical protein